jgi:ABC-type glycerol-3-phosphate transport system substrate-binding protein
LNDVAAGIIHQYGDFDDNARYCAYQDGTWLSLPLSFAAWSFPLVTRMDYWQQDAGMDVTELFPADVTKRQASKIATFTWDTFLGACKRLAAAGHMFGNPISGCIEANAWLWPLLLSFGAVPVTATGDIAVESDATLAGIEFVVELSQSMPRDIYRWTNASNDHWLLAGNGAAIVDAPNFWVRAKQEQPAVAARLWHHDAPAGPHGRFRSVEFSTYGIWRFSPHKQAARDLLRHLLQQEQQWKLLHAAQGVDRPALKAFASHPVWRETGPPPGGLYNYLPRGDKQLIPYGWPAPPAIAIRIANKYVIPTMMARAATGKMTPKEAMQWAARVLEAAVKG